MLRARFLYVLTASVAVGMPGSAGRAAPVRDHDVVPEDYFTIAVITECAVFAPPPGLAAVAYVDMRWDKASDGRNLDLWVFDSESQARTRLTFDEAADRSPVWSADGRWIYFASNRKQPEAEGPPLDGKTQVWRIRPEGGPAQAVTRIEDGIGLFTLAKDGKTLYYTRSEEHIDDEWKKLRKRYKDLEYGHGVTDFSQVWKLDLESWRDEKVVDEKRVIREMAVSHDQSRIAMLTCPDNTLLANEGWSRIDVYDTATKETTTVTPEGWREPHPSPYGWLGGLTWSLDGDALAFTTSFDGYASRLYVVEWLDGSPSLRRLSLHDVTDLGEGPLQWRGASRDLAFVGEWKARKRVYAIPHVRDGQQGRPVVLTPGDIAVDTFACDDTGRHMITVLSKTTHPPDLYGTQFDNGQPGPLKRLLNNNPQVDTWKLPSIEIVQWTGSGGTECGGILELPPGYKPEDGPLPMIVELHGGPTASTLYRLRLWIYGRTLMPAKGYALFSPNYRGSTGYGETFTSQLVGRENDIEVEDILTGVDAMIERGIADPDRLGVMGWSNGGFLTNCVITHTERFKAASSGAGIVDMLLQWGTEDTPGHVVNFMQGFAWNKPDAYRSASPIFNLAKIKTPTIIHVGGNDERCPPAHCRALYRALRHYLDVPVELVVYPGEGHGLRKYKNRLAKMEWDLAWFDKYLLGKTGEGDENDDRKGTADAGDAEGDDE